MFYSNALEHSPKGSFAPYRTPGGADQPYPPAAHTLIIYTHSINLRNPDER